MSARRIVADALSAGLGPDRRVYPHAVSPDGVRGVAVAVERTAVRPGISQGLRAEDVAVYILTGIEDVGRAEDALDGALDDVLAVLDASPALSFTQAERVSVENFHAYQVTVTLQTQN